MAKYEDDMVSIKHQKLENVDLTEPIDTQQLSIVPWTSLSFLLGAQITTNNEVTRGNNKHQYCGVDW